MLDKARQKGMYDALHLDSYIHYMAQKEGAYDFVLAVDSLLYTGPLEEIFERVDTVLRSHGAFVFTVEMLDSGSFEVQSTARHAHGEEYIRNLAAEHGIKVRLCEFIEKIRANIKGTVFWLEKVG